MKRIVLCTVGTSLLDNRKSIVAHEVLTPLKKRLEGYSSSVCNLLLDGNFQPNIVLIVNTLTLAWNSLMLDGQSPAARVNALEALPAELCSLAAMGIKQIDVVVLIYSESGEGAFCAACIQGLLQSLGIANCKLTVDNATSSDLVCEGGVTQIQKLDARTPKEFELTGIPNLQNKILDLVQAAPDGIESVTIDVTGGYKPQSLYTALIGLLSRVRVSFLHEQSLGEAMQLPSLPIDFALLTWHENAAAMKYILEVPVSEVRVLKLPRLLQDLLVPSGDRYILTAFGQAIRRRYELERYKISVNTPFDTDQLLGLIKHEGLKTKLLDRFSARADFLSAGNQIPEMVDHGRGHAQRLLEFAAQLILPLQAQAQEFLTEQELYFLINCLWLHDIGYAGGSLTINGEKIPITSSHLVRELHNLLTEMRLAEFPEMYGFSDGSTDERNLIATICKYNRTKMPLCEGSSSFERNVYGHEVKINKPIAKINEVTIGGSKCTVRTRLLAALLRVIDACDEQKERAGTREYQVIRNGVTREEAERAEERRKQMKKIVLSTSNNAYPIAAFQDHEKWNEALDKEEWKESVKSLRNKSKRTEADGRLLEALTLYWDLFDAAHFKKFQDDHFHKHAQIEWARLSPKNQSGQSNAFVLVLKPIDNANEEILSKAIKEIEEDFKGADCVLKEFDITLSVAVVNESDAQ